MPRRYFTEIRRACVQSNTSPFGNLVAAAASPIPSLIYDILVGSEAAPADNAFLWEFQRCSDKGTTPTATVTPVPLDSADAAASGVGFQGTYATNPTLTASKIALAIPLNQRATFRWVAAPGGELMIPATANNGFGILTTIASAVSATVGIFHQE